MRHLTLVRHLSMINDEIRITDAVTGELLRTYRQHELLMDGPTHQTAIRDFHRLKSIKEPDRLDESRLWC